MDSVDKTNLHVPIPHARRAITPLSINYKRFQANSSEIKIPTKALLSLPKICPSIVLNPFFMGPGDSGVLSSFTYNP